ncbi:sigma-E processing peptidase SpoIIGA [Paenibacillus sp. N1-5-1-14]|uniref:sigma-E processing peptidase SpoIIGA n=1 Tax=Paenibacillus radicibacter TaxID=2972488 RepID=UPI0021596A13|nr:sigma-E processing peptidase SpoIIGA [Paenibacillus radicibacter]MCR8641910.1 sigma-E processing peptidase SpoIIGA [Paenibacillus radicibacter]
MTVYLDLIFLFNFFMDGAILYTTIKIRKEPVIWWRLLLSSAIGASYVVMMFFPALSFSMTFFVKIIFSLLMIWVAFPFKSLANYLRHYGLFYVVNFVAGGGIFGIKYALQSSGEIMNGIWFTHTGFMYTPQMTVLFIVLVAILMLVLIRKMFAIQRRREQLTTYLAKVTVEVDGNTWSCTGLIDTGNQLYDPLSRLPVMVMEVGQWEAILPEKWVTLIRQSKTEQLLATIGDEEWKWQDRLRLVPYRGVNRSSQFMLAIKPDRVIISQENGQTESAKVLIGLDSGHLCRDGSYQAIIHPALVAGGAL